MIFRANILLILSISSLLTRFLFRREKKSSQERDAAADDLFEAIRLFVATVATLKPEWVMAWEQRTDVDLPPKYQPDQYLYPRAVQAAIDAKFARGLLYQNRWNSRIEPLFETFDPNTWSQVRATIERWPASLLAIREAHIRAFRAEELSWIDRAVEGIDESRHRLRNAERTETRTHEVIASSTFQALYTVLQLSETMLDGLRREALDK